MEREAFLAELADALANRNSSLEVGRDEASLVKGQAVVIVSAYKTELDSLGVTSTLVQTDSSFKWTIKDESGNECEITLHFTQGEGWHFDAYAKGGYLAYIHKGTPTVQAYSDEVFEEWLQVCVSNIVQCFQFAPVEAP